MRVNELPIRVTMGQIPQDLPADPIDFHFPSSMKSEHTKVNKFSSANLKSCIHVTICSVL